VEVWLLLIGSPCSRSPSATPSRSGARTLPIVRAHDQPVRQRALSRFPRHSNDTPRPNSATSTSTRARYRAENIVAYQPGKAANIEPPATISHTSFPSHHGPIVLIA